MADNFRAMMVDDRLLVMADNFIAMMVDDSLLVMTGNLSILTSFHTIIQQA